MLTKERVRMSGVEAACEGDVALGVKLEGVACIDKA